MNNLKECLKKYNIRLFWSCFKCSMMVKSAMLSTTPKTNFTPLLKMAFTLQLIFSFCLVDAQADGIFSKLSSCFGSLKKHHDNVVIIEEEEEKTEDLKILAKPAS